MRNALRQALQQQWHTPGGLRSGGNDVHMPAAAGRPHLQRHGCCLVDQLGLVKAAQQEVAYWLDADEALVKGRLGPGWQRLVVVLLVLLGRQGERALLTPPLPAP